MWRIGTIDEVTILRVSIAATVTVAAAGIAMGLTAGSTAIMFDGVYSLADAAMTGLALGVARLIAASNAADASGGRLHERFTMGFWHLEPMVLGLNGVLLTAAAVYALINAADSLLGGGRALAFDIAIAYAGVLTAIDVGMAIFTTLANRRVRSRLVGLDAQAWSMAAALGGALFLAFLAGHALQGSAYAWLAPYVDPAALALICLVVIPLPFRTIREALSDVLLVTPQDLQDRVSRVAEDVVERFGFLSHRAYVARVGRGRQIELNFIVPREWPARRLEDWDALRDEIGEALGDDTPDRWLTIVFTTDPGWAF